MTFKEAFLCLEQGIEIKNPTAFPGQSFRKILGEGIKDQTGSIMATRLFKIKVEEKKGTIDGWEAAVETIEEIKEPPIGLSPRYLHIENRLNKISAAVNRYKKEELSPPLEWLEEFYELNAWLARYRINKNMKS